MKFTSKWVLSCREDPIAPIDALIVCLDLFKLRSVTNPVVEITLPAESFSNARFVRNLYERT